MFEGVSCKLGGVYSESREQGIPRRLAVKKASTSFRKISGDRVIVSRASNQMAQHSKGSLDFKSLGGLQWCGCSQHLWQSHCHWIMRGGGAENRIHVDLVRLEIQLLDCPDSPLPERARERRQPFSMVLQTCSCFQCARCQRKALPC